MKLVDKYLFKSITVLRNKYLSLMNVLYEREVANKFKKCGRNIKIYYPCEITGFDNIEIGENVHINRGGLIRGEGGLKIGDNVHIGRNLVLYTINHNYKGDALPYDSTILKKPVVIENNVWIGVNVTIIPGVTIGEGSIIGAGTVISRDVPSLAIVGSAPLRIIKYRDENQYMNLLAMKKYGGVNGTLYGVEE